MVGAHNMHIEVISPQDVKDMKEKVVPAYFSSINEELLSWYNGREFNIYYQDIESKASKSLDISWNAFCRLLPSNILDLVVTKYTDSGWVVLKSGKLKCNQDPHLTFMGD